MKNYTLMPEVLLRTPALSLSKLQENLKAATSGKPDLGFLKTVYRNEQVQEALFLASPDMHTHCLDWLQGKINDPKERRRLENSLLRYYLRMSTRCTPFGLFAGCSMGHWDRTTDIELKAFANALRHTRLDMHYLVALTQYLSEHDAIRPHVKFFPNSSYYEFGDKIRFIEYRYLHHQRVHQISAVDNSPYLSQLLKAAERGRSITTLARGLCAEGIHLEEAEGFVQEVIDAQLLVSELEPAITGEDLLEQVLKILRNISCDERANSPFLQQVIDKLSKVNKLLRNLDDSECRQKLETYARIGVHLESLGVPYDISKLFQVDMGRKTAELKVKNRLAGSIRKGLDVLNRLRFRDHQKPYHLRRYQSMSNLKQFQNAFFKRYETKSVPLLQVMDNESGIGYLQSAAPGDAHPMIDDIQPGVERRAESIQLDERESFLFNKLLLAAQEETYEIEFKEEELDGFSSSWGDLPDTLSVMGALVQENGKEKVYINYAGGSSAANLLGRFTHLDPDIDKFVKKLTRWEQDLHQDVVFAEIVHLPQARTGNILMRTQLRSYEIPFLAKASTDSAHQIQLQDLWLSVKNDRLFLYSKKLQKEVIPRLSTAHNYTQSSLPVYHFLCDLQFQQLPGHLRANASNWVAGDVVDLQYRQMVSHMAFNWGSLSRSFRFLPRVSYQNVILHRATWQLSRKDYKGLLSLKRPDRIDAVKAWRTHLNMPRYIVVADYDNELFIDLENALCLDVFTSLLKKRDKVELKEFLFDPETAKVRDEDQQAYTNEFIMAFARKAWEEEPVEKKPLAPKTSLQRSFPVGSEWLYYKIYCGAQSADDLLIRSVKPLTERLKAEKLIDHWFFIRYSDPDLHLRLRFHMPDTSHLGRVIQLINEYLDADIQSRQIWKVQADTYEREIERYGARSMEYSERMFYHDSEAIIQFLREAEYYQEPELLRWYFAMLSIDQLLESFDLSLGEKTRLLGRMKTNFAMEFRTDNKYGTKQMSEKYRQHREVIDDIVAGHNSGYPEDLMDIIQRKYQAVSADCAAVLPIFQAADSRLSLPSFISSHIHMLMNRLFRSQQRKYELVIYDMLHRGYRSLLARNQKKKKISRADVPA